VKKYFFLISLIFFVSVVIAQTEEEIFEEVFNNPQSLELNFKLARLQLKNGNYKGAAASLERILVRLPNESTAQLLLARVNIQLNNPTEAKRLYEEIIANVNAPKENILQARRELGLAIEEIEDALWSLSGFVSVGWGKKNNARAASVNNEVLFFDNIFENSIDDQPEYFRQGTIGLNLIRDLGNNNRFLSNVVLNDRSYGSSYKEGRNQSYLVGAGIDYEMFGGSTKFMLNSGEMHLAKQNFIGFYGLDVEHRRLIAPNLLLNIGINATKNDFRHYDGISDNNDKSGWVHKGSIGLTKSWQHFKANVGYVESRTSAKEDHYSFKGNQINMSLTTDHGPGATTLFKTVIKNNYEAANTTISNDERRDIINFYGINWMIGLKGWDIPKPGEPTLNVMYRKGSSLSNLSNFKRKDEEEWMLSLSRTF